MANDKQGRRIGRPKFSTLIALVALFAALGGSAYAGGKLINGKNIKAGSVKSKQLKDGTIKTKDINSKAISSLQGAKGATGDTGATGPQGPAGPAGADGKDGTNGTNGIISPLSGSTDASTGLPNGLPLAVKSITVTAGTSYVVNAKTQLGSGVGVSEVTCTLSRGGTVDQVSWTPNSATSKTPAALQAVVGGNATTLTIGCESTGGTATALQTKITAIPVG